MSKINKVKCQKSIWSNVKCQKSIRSNEKCQKSIRSNVKYQKSIRSNVKCQKSIRSNVNCQKSIRSNVKCQKSIRSNVKCQKSIRSNVKCQKSIRLILTERTSGVPPVIFKYVPILRLQFLFILWLVITAHVLNNLRGLGSWPERGKVRGSKAFHQIEAPRPKQCSRPLKPSGDHVDPPVRPS